VADGVAEGCGVVEAPLAVRPVVVVVVGMGRSWARVAGKKQPVVQRWE
jgi:hypothetical protein